MVAWGKVNDFGSTDYLHLYQFTKMLSMPSPRQWLCSTKWGSTDNKTYWLRLLCSNYSLRNFPYSIKYLGSKKKENELVKKLYLGIINCFFVEPLVGFEPTTPRLQITCSGQLS